MEGSATIAQGTIDDGRVGQGDRMAMDQVDAGTVAEGGAAGQPREVNPYARKALIASVVGYAMDGFDLLILSFMLPAVVIGLHLTPTRSRIAGHMDADRRRHRRADRRRAERPVRPHPRPVVDDPAVRGLHRPVRAGAGLLGPADLSHHRRHRAGRRVRHRHGAGRRGLAGAQARAGVVLLRARLAGRRDHRRAGDAAAPAGDRLARHVPARARCRPWSPSCCGA